MIAEVIIVIAYANGESHSTVQFSEILIRLSNTHATDNRIHNVQIAIPRRGICAILKIGERHRGYGMHTISSYSVKAFG